VMPPNVLRIDWKQLSRMMADVNRHQSSVPAFKSKQKGKEKKKKQIDKKQKKKEFDLEINSGLNPGELSAWTRDRLALKWIVEEDDAVSSERLWSNS